MLILAVDSSTPVAGVALLDEARLIREEFVNYKKNHSETLMPMIDEMLRVCDKCLADIGALAVTIGPGSFTGLRIGLAAVKGLSMAAGIPVVAVSTLEVLAHNLAGSDTLVCPVLNARKMEVYGAMFTHRGQYPCGISDEMACPPHDFAVLARCKAEQEGIGRISLLGDGYPPYRQIFHDSLGEWLVAAPSHLQLPRASALGNLALARIADQNWAEVLSLRPHYVRLSEAESRLGRGEL